jgi:hypothetical protein
MTEEWNPVTEPNQTLVQQLRDLAPRLDQCGTDNRLVVEAADRIEAALLALEPPDTVEEGVSMCHSVYDNMESALNDLERQGVDAVCIKTLRRAQARVAKATRALEGKA